MCSEFLNLDMIVILNCCSKKLQAILFYFLLVFWTQGFGGAMMTGTQSKVKITSLVLEKNDSEDCCGDQKIRSSDIMSRVISCLFLVNDVTMQGLTLKSYGVSKRSFK